MQLWIGTQFAEGYGALELHSSTQDTGIFMKRKEFLVKFPSLSPFNDAFLPHYIWTTSSMNSSMAPYSPQHGSDFPPTCSPVNLSQRNTFRSCKHSNIHVHIAYSCQSTITYLHHKEMKRLPLPEGWRRHVSPIPPAKYKKILPLYIKPTVYN